ncbi:uridine kinase [Brucella gallinifaecis]|uniref:uridine kinase n=1 Tax=Brucella gallinifaecis TaxID=215590 RepID=UPI0023610326|nr:uridine kinase [Brucella gallinifaecis]
MLSRLDFLEDIASRIIPITGRVAVAIDGVDGAGKTTFADELTPVIESYGRTTLRVSVDGFHNPRTLRYKRGKDSPEGFFLDSYNYKSLYNDLLQPFKSNAPSVQVACFDHKSDKPLKIVEAVSSDTVLLLDGIFLHRDELQHLWDFSIFLSVPFSVSYARMAERDSCDPDPFAPENRRYLEGQNIYLRSCRPQERATIVFENVNS